jgi:Flp pilus assembly protein TadB
MDLVTACGVSIAILSLGLAIPSGRRDSRRLLNRLLERSQRQLAEARISGNARTYLALSIVAPAALFALGWLQSPVLAVGAAIAGLLAPRLYIALMVQVQSRRSEAEAPRLLQALLAGLASGGTYLDALRQARLSVTDRWLHDDLDFVIQRFLLDAPLHESLMEVRARTTTRNLGLIWDTLRICTEHHLPTQKARTLLIELSATVQFNVQLANEVKARSSGQRAQIWLLAVIVPGLYLYLRLMSPQLLSVLDDTMLGRFVLFPLAALLQVAGIVLSVRIARFEA